MGKAVAYVRDGVRAVAPLIDGDAPCDLTRYHLGVFKINGISSQEIAVPKGSLLYKSLAISPQAAGRAIVTAMERSNHRWHDFELERRQLLLPEGMQSPRSGSVTPCDSAKSDEEDISSADTDP